MIVFPEILADECVDRRLIDHLQSSGYIVVDIFNSARGSDDATVISLANNLKAFIITEDKDFGNELVYNKAFHFGTLLLRLEGMLIEEKKKLLVSVLQHYSDELIGNFSVLTKDKLRIRKQHI
jgi:predicted nuclease of predicted toxin-antitoxin system